jgi:type II secretory ATPase GspE/PulE/Tfp pilus assembly ATPase PilB-like protein
MLAVTKKALENLKVEGEIDPKLVEKMQFYEAPGCDKCNNIGYKGRVGLYELLRMNNELRKLISEGATMIQFQEAAQKGGMVTLEQCGVIRALEGKTTLEEVYRVARKSE